MPKKILVTGASGFIASHTIVELLNRGYEVRGTIRDLVNADKVRAVLSTATDKASGVEFVAATLTDQTCWPAAVEGCDSVIHLASPVPIEQPDDADEIVKPAKEGALNVLSAATSAGIKKVVMTSSVAAVSHNPQCEEHAQTSDDWSDVNSSRITPYQLSKTIAERAAWDYVDKTNGLELVTINPSLVLGPTLETDYGSSLEALLLLLQGAYPLLPKIGFGIVDVRDVAILHRIALESPEAAGQRLLCSNGFRWFSDISIFLAEQFPDYAKKLPRRELPNFVVRILALFDKVLASIVDDLGKVVEYDCSPARNLGWQPRPPEEAISAGAKSLMDFGVV